MRILQQEENMAEKTIAIDFEGYRRDKNKGGLPAISGVYCVYSCTYDVNENIVSIHKLIYIGEAGDIKSRIADHEKYNDWLKYVDKGDELCFSYGAVESSDRLRAEAAMIFKHNPPENVEYTDSFPFDKTIMSLSGKTAKLHTNFTVNRTE